jgi:hypothetical protein
MKSGRMRWTGQAVRIEEIERHRVFWVEDMNRISRLEDLYANWRIILKYFINK